MALSLHTRAAYAAPGFAFALVGIPVYVHLPKFYGDTLQVNLSFIGAMILLSRMWDAAIDPAVGYLSDRTRTHLGRRRPFLAGAAVPLGLSAALLMAPPALAANALGWWFGALLFVMFLCWTAIQIPHAALGAEIAPGYHERTSIFAMRDGLWILGTLTAAIAPTAMRSLLSAPEGPQGDRIVFGALAWFYAPLLIALPLWCAAVVREPPMPSTPPDSPYQASIEAWQNRPFRILLIAYGVGGLGAALPATLLLFYVEHVLGARSLADVFLAAYFLTGFLCLPFWTFVSRLIGKKRAWLFAIALSLAAFSGAAFLGRGDVLAFAVIVVVSGIGFGASLVLPASLVADTIDYDQFRSGRRREGLYYGLWAIVTKLSAAFGAAVALPALERAGYVPQGEQPEAVVSVLKVLYAGVPCLFYVAALFVAARFPIDERRHRAIRDAIDRRVAGEEVGDPLVAEGVA